MGDNNWQSTVIYDLKMGPVQRGIYLTLSTIVAVSNIAVNSFLIHAVWKFKKLKLASYVFIFALSISDVFVGLIQLPIQLTPLLSKPRNIDSKTLCVQFFVYFVTQCSGGMIMMIAVDRFFHMKYLTKYNMYMTRNKALVIVGVILLTSFFMALLLILATIYGFFFEYQMVLNPCYLASLPIVFVVYLRTYKAITKRQKVQNLGDRRRASRRANQDFARAMVYITAGVFVCYLPSIILQLTRSVLCKTGIPTDSVLNALLWSYLIAYVNSSFNAIIFIAYNKELRKYTFSFWKKNSVVDFDTSNQAFSTIKNPVSRLQSNSIDS